MQKPKHIIREQYSEEEYDNFLDEVYGDVDIAGYTYRTSQILKEVDSIAYRCGFLEYQDEIDIYICPVCEAEYENEDEALYCCQEKEDE